MENLRKSKKNRGGHIISQIFAPNGKNLSLCLFQIPTSVSQSQEGHGLRKEQLLTELTIRRFFLLVKNDVKSKSKGKKGKLEALLKNNKLDLHRPFSAFPNKLAGWLCPLFHFPMVLFLSFAFYHSLSLSALAFSSLNSEFSCEATKQTNNFRLLLKGAEESRGEGFQKKTSNKRAHDKKNGKMDK
jgi:hypothetical protein